MDQTCQLKGRLLDQMAEQKACCVLFTTLMLESVAVMVEDGSRYVQKLIVFQNLDKSF